MATQTFTNDCIPPKMKQAAINLANQLVNFNATVFRSSLIGVEVEVAELLVSCGFATFDADRMNPTALLFETLEISL